MSLPASPLTDEQHQARAAMLALRDLANRCVEHALDVADCGERETSLHLNILAGELRDAERARATAAGIFD